MLAMGLLSKVGTGGSLQSAVHGAQSGRVASRQSLAASRRGQRPRPRAAAPPILCPIKNPATGARFMRNAKSRELVQGGGLLGGALRTWVAGLSAVESHHVLCLRAFGALGDLK